MPAAVGPESPATRGPRASSGMGRCIAHTKDAVWAFQLGHRAAEITERLPGKPALKFVPGPLPEPGAAPIRRPPLDRPATLRREHPAEWAAAIEARGFPRRSSPGLPQPPSRAARASRFV